MSEGHRVAVYYQTQYDRSLPANSPYGHYVSPLPLIQYITHLLLAAFHINMKSVDVHLNDYRPEDPWYAQMWQDIAVMQSQGVKVIGMLGGAAPGSYECLTPDKFDTYYPILAGYISQYKLDGMDLDVEQRTDISVITNLISRLKTDFGPDFIITLAPVASALTEGGNLSGFDYIDLEQRAGANISWYNAQFYSGFGTFFPDTQYINIVNYGKGLDPNRLVATSLTNPSNGGGYINPTNVASSAKDLSAKFGFNFGGVAAWEYFNSNPNSTEPWRWAELMKTTMAQLKAEKRKAEEEKQQAELTKRSRVWRGRA